MDAEQIGPEWDRLRQAELLAALHNGPVKKRGSDHLFTAADFLRDPWSPPPEPVDLEAELLTRIEAAFPQQAP